MSVQQVTDLAAWLTQIWDEEERLANEAAIEGNGVFRPNWHPGGYPFSGIELLRDPAVGFESAAQRHIGLHDPAAVLARIAADRKILAAYQDAAPPYGSADQQVTHDVLGEVLRMLASAYADRPGYQDAWAV